MPRFLALVFLTATLFAGEEIIDKLKGEKGCITLESGRVLHFADDPLVDQALNQMEEGDVLNVRGSGVVVVSHKGTDLLLFADESEFQGQPIDSISLYALPRAGSRHIAILLRHNLPKTTVRIHAFPNKLFCEALRGLGNLNQARIRLQTEGVVEQTIGESTLALIALRAPRAYLESLYRSCALPFKEDVARGFDLFLNGDGRLPHFIQQRNPLTHERCTDPLQVRQLMLVKALFVERSAHKSLVVDYEKWREDQAGLIARICAEYGSAHTPYFKEATLDLSGRGPYRPEKPLDLSITQEVQMRVKLDRKLEQHFGFEV